MSFIIKALNGDKYTVHEVGAVYKTKEAAMNAMAALVRIGEKRKLLIDQPKLGRPFGSKNAPDAGDAIVSSRFAPRVTVTPEQVERLISTIRENIYGKAKDESENAKTTVKVGSGEYEISLPNKAASNTGKTAPAPTPIRKTGTTNR